MRKLIQDIKSLVKLPYSLTPLYGHLNSTHCNEGFPRIVPNHV